MTVRMLHRYYTMTATEQTQNESPRKFLPYGGF